MLVETVGHWVQELIYVCREELIVDARHSRAEKLANEEEAKPLFFVEVTFLGSVALKQEFYRIHKILIDQVHSSRLALRVSLHLLEKKWHVSEA